MSEFDPIGSLTGAPPVNGAEVFAALSARLPTLAGQANVKLTLADIATFVLPFLETHIIIGNLTIVSAPSITGDFVVGERLYAVHGAYNLTPDSFTNKWFLDAVQIVGEDADNLLITDDMASKTPTYGEIAHKAGYTDPALNMAP
jgi:hypothetical protein